MAADDLEEVADRGMPQTAPREGETAAFDGLVLRVRDAAGEPISSVRVVPIPTDPTVEMSIEERAAARRQFQYARVHVTVVSPGEYQVAGIDRGGVFAVAAAGYAPQYLSLPAEPTGEQTVTMERGPLISGIVRNADGSPPAEVRVGAHYQGQPTDAFYEMGNRYSASDATYDPATGAFEFRGLLPGCEYRVVAELWWQRTATATATAGDTGVVLRFDPLAVLRGRITRPDGSAPAEAKIRFSYLTAWLQQPPPWLTYDTATGEYEALLRAATYDVGIGSTDGFTASGSVTTTLGNATIADFSLSPPAPLAVVVQDAAGAPIADAEVSVRAGLTREAVGQITKEAVTGPDGRAAFDGLPQYEREVTVTVPGARPLKERVPATQATLTVRLQSSATVEVVIVGPGGEPYTDVERIRLGGSDQTEVVGDGVFRFRNVRPGEHRLQVDWEAGVSFRRSVTVIAGEANRVTIDMQPADAELRVRLFIGTHRVTSRWTVGVTTPLADLADQPLMRRHFQASEDESGEIVMQVPAGRWFIRPIQLRGFDAPDDMVYEVAPGESKAIDLRIEGWVVRGTCPEPAVESFHRTVVRAHPLFPANGVVRGREGSDTDADPTADGEYQISYLAPGRWRLVAYEGGGTQRIASTIIEPNRLYGLIEHDFTMQESGSLEVRVAGIEGEFSGYISLYGESFQAMESLDSRRPVIRRVPPGRYEVIARRYSMAVHRATVEIRPGEATVLEVPDWSESDRLRVEVVDGGSDDATQAYGLLLLDEADDRYVLAEGRLRKEVVRGDPLPEAEQTGSIRRQYEWSVSWWIELPRVAEGTYSLRVLDTDGEIVATHRVIVTSDGSSPTQIVLPVIPSGG